MLLIYLEYSLSISLNNNNICFSLQRFFLVFILKYYVNPFVNTFKTIVLIQLKSANVTEDKSFPFIFFVLKLKKSYYECEISVK